jgi:adenylosuccinate lyase
MPHKRNPILSENLCGLARVVRAAVTPALENIVLWHERDISHSSMERMMVPDVTTTMAFMLDRTKGLVEGLVVYPQNLQRSLDRAGDLFFSEGLLLALVEAGMARQEAYVWVQRNAMKAWRGEGTLQSNVLADADITAKLSKERIDTCFDLHHVLRFANVMVERALA